MFGDLRQFVSLTYSSGGGLGMGVSAMDDCSAKYKRTEGGFVNLEAVAPAFLKTSTRACLQLAVMQISLRGKLTPFSLCASWAQVVSKCVLTAMRLTTGTLLPLVAGATT
jgi:hypothetical protein